MDSEVLLRHRSGGERGFPRGRKTPADTSEDVDVSERRGSCPLTDSQETQSASLPDLVLLLVRRTPVQKERRGTCARPRSRPPSFSNHPSRSRCAPRSTTPEVTPWPCGSEPATAAQLGRRGEGSRREVGNRVAPSARATRRSNGRARERIVESCSSSCVSTDHVNGRFGDDEDGQRGKHEKRGRSRRPRARSYRFLPSARGGQKNRRRGKTEDAQNLLKCPRVGLHTVDCPDF